MADAAMNQPRPALPHRLKQRIKPFYRRGRRWLSQALYGYGVDELTAAVRGLGIDAGDCLLMHAGFRRDSGFRGGPADVIDGLLDLLGPDGHLLMLSMAYTGASEDYCAADPLFDVQRTPSAVGLLSEMFRRRDDVLRSLNPLHPVLVHGPLAPWLVADHDKSAYSCGKGSPFERLLTLDGKFLFLDAPYNALTFMHYVEDYFRDRLPVALYDPEPMIVRVRDADGRELRLRQYCFAAAARRRRNFGPIEDRLRAEGCLREQRLGRSRLLMVSARDVFDCAAGLVERGPGFYR